MLEWPPGSRDTDGVWAKYWYGAVERSTRFQPYVPKSEPVPEELIDLLWKCEALYEQLAAHRLRPAFTAPEPPQYPAGPRRSP
jgi:hypothetical protein